MTSTRRAGVRAVAEIARPALVGAGISLLISWRRATGAAEDDRVLGIASPEVASAIATSFPDEVRAAAWLVGGVALLWGAALGSLASALVQGRYRLALLPAPRGIPLLCRSMVVMAGLWGLALALGMAMRPAPYSDAFYARGGPLRLAHVASADLLGPWGVALGGTVALTLTLLGRPGTWSRSLGNAAWHARRHLTGVTGALALIVALTVLALWPTSRRVGGDLRPNVLVLAADSLRGDRVVPRTMPHLTELARHSVSFERAYVSLPRTFPSWVTWLTGRYPHHHGIRTMFPSLAARARDFDALPQRLRAAGYATAVASDYAGDIFPRIPLGFERIDTPTFQLGELVRERALLAQTAMLPAILSPLGRALLPTVRGMSLAPDAADTARRTLQAIDGAGQRPFFVVGFFSSTHFPYAAERPGYGRFTDPSYRGRFKYAKAHQGGHEAPLDEADTAQVRGLYDGAASVVDEAMESVLRGLRARGLSERTIVIVTADHGETLFDAGRGHGHGDHLFGEEALRVPLIVHDGRSPRVARVEAVTRDVDLASTIYELTGVAPPRDLDGRTLSPALSGASLAPRPAFVETGLWMTDRPDGVPSSLRIPYPDASRLLEVRREAGNDIVLQEAWEPVTRLAKHRAIITEHHKLVLAPTRAGAQALLFDLRADPGALRDVASQQPETAAALREQLLEWVLQDRDLELRGSHLVSRRGALDLAREPDHSSVRLGVK